MAEAQFFMKLADAGHDILNEVRRLANTGPLWPAPFNEDTPEAAYAFLMECKTFVESNKGPMKLPDKEYIRWITHYWWHTRKCGKPLVIWKSRRIIVSWIMRCLRVWDCGLAQGFVQMGARVLDGPAGARQFVWRCWYIYDWLMKDHPQWKLKACQWSGNPKKYELDSLVFPNGTLISAVNLDEETVRGSGASAVEMEELNFTREVAATWAQGITVCQGPAGEPSGHPITINNTSPNVEWKAMKKRVAGWDERIPRIPDIIGCKAYEAGEGNLVLEIHYTCDEAKRSPEWVAGAKVGIEPRRWMREMDMNEQIFDGVAVYSAFAADFHLMSSYKAKLGIVPGAMWFMGWDCGNTLKPAALLNQLLGGQLQAIEEFIPLTGMSMDQFVPYVLSALRTKYPEIIAMEHLADESGANRQGARGETAFSIAAEHGIVLQAMTNNPDKRIGDMSWFLQRNLAECQAARSAVLNGDPIDPSLANAQIGYIVDDEKCPVLASGFLGGYKMAASAQGDTSGPGLILQAPLKNDFSHIHDCQQYIAMRVRQIVENRFGRVVSVLGNVGVPELDWGATQILQ